MMKRYIQILSFALCAMFAFAACNVTDLDNPTPEETPAPEYPYEIRLVPPTKTANDGLSTVWVDGDKVNIFHAEAGTTDYINDGAFTFSTEDRFTGSLKQPLEDGKMYDWYVAYPYDPSMTSPKYMRITVPTVQTQLADGDMSHLCEALCPLAGKSTEVAASANPNVVMNHLVTVMKIKVTNYESAPCNLTKVSLNHHSSDANTILAGVHYLDMTGDSMHMTRAEELGADNITLPEWEDNSSMTKASVLEGDPTRPCIQLTSPKTLGLNESATVYMVCIPFTIGHATELEIGMNSENSGVSQRICKEVSCKAGVINGVKQGSRQAPPFKSNVTFYHGKKNADGTYTIDNDGWWRCELPKGFDLQGSFNFKDLFTTTNVDAKFEFIDKPNQNATVQSMYDQFKACLDPATGQWTGNSSLEVNLSFPDSDRGGIFVNSTAGYRVGAWPIIYYEPTK